MHAAPAAAEAWATVLAGPMRLHTAMLSVHATALASGSTGTAVADRTAAVLQLKLAGRRLRALAAAEAAETSTPHSVAAAEWAAAAAIAATTLQAHLPALQDATQRDEVCACPAAYVPLLSAMPPSG